MKKQLYVFIFLLSSLSSYTAAAFKISGKVKNATEGQIQLTLYRDWFSDPETFTVHLDTESSFYFEGKISEIAYIDINYGLNGLLFQIIEPKDDIHITLDENDFYSGLLVTGRGGAKWMYYQKQRLFFEEIFDTEREVTGLLSLPKEEYMSKIDLYQNQQLQILEDAKNYVSEDFFVLRRADIIGKMNTYRLKYFTKNGFPTDVFGAFELPVISSKNQPKSFEFNQFVEDLTEAYKQANNKNDNELIEDYTLIKYLFEKGLIERPITEKLLAMKLKNSIINLSDDENLAILSKDFIQFSFDAALANDIKYYLSKYNTKVNGGPFPSFTLADVNGKFFSLSDYKKKYVVLMFWNSYCIPCQADLTYIPIIHNYFKKKAKLAFINIALDNQNDYQELAEEIQQVSRTARIETNNSLVKKVGVNNIPYYILIDKEGNWLTDELIEPGYDEGRGMIRQLEDIILKK